MLQHMKVCKKWPFPHDDKQKTLSFQAKREGESGMNVLVVANYSEERIRLALARMIIIDELSFKFVEHQHPSNKKNFIKHKNKVFTTISNYNFSSNTISNSSLPINECHNQIQ